MIKRSDVDIDGAEVSDALNSIAKAVEIAMAILSKLGFQPVGFAGAIVFVGEDGGSPSRIFCLHDADFKEVVDGEETEIQNDRFLRIVADVIAQQANLNRVAGSN